MRMASMRESRDSDWFLVNTQVQSQHWCAEGLALQCLSFFLWYTCKEILQSLASVTISNMLDGWTQVSPTLVNWMVNFLYTSKMIYHGGRAWVSMHSWFNVLSWYTNHGWQQDLSSLVPMPLPLEAKLRAAISPVKEATTVTYTLGLNFTSYQLNLWRLWVSLCMALTWSELKYCTWFDDTAWEQPVMVCSCNHQRGVSERSITSIFMREL